MPTTTSIASLNAELDSIVIARSQLDADAQDLQDTFVRCAFSMRGKPWPYRLRPLLLPSAVASDLLSVAEEIVSLLEHAAADYLAGEQRIRSFFHWLEPFAEFISTVTPTGRLVEIARLDGTIDSAGTFQLFETNTACPSGFSQTGWAYRAWQLTDTARQYLARTGAPLDTPMTADPALFGSHLSAFAGGDPIAVVTLPSGYPYEIPAIEYTCGQVGSNVVSAGAGDITVSGTATKAGHRRVGAMYLKMAPEHLLNGDALDGLRLAVATTPTIASFVAGLVAESKAVLAWLWSTIDDQPPRQRTLIQQHIPWTCVLDRSPIRHPSHGRALPVELALNYQKQFCIKPAAGTQGEGLMLGHDTDSDAWTRTINRVLGGTEPFVLQEHIPMFATRHRSDTDDVLQPHNTDLHMYVLGGTAIGFGARSKSSSPVNVWAGGSWLPVAVVA